MLDRFDWQPGHREALLGPNGAGKSTVIKLATGSLVPHRGRIVPDATGQPGYLPQATLPVGGLTAREQVAFAGWMNGMSRDDAWRSAAVALDGVGLGGRQDRRVRDLSGSQLRRVGIAEVLVNRPTSVFLDEPAVGLDPMQRALLRDVLSEIEVDQLVISTHQVDDLDRLVDTVTVISSGRLLYQGPVSDFLRLGEASGDTASALPAERAYSWLLAASPTA